MDTYKEILNKYADYKGKYNQKIRDIIKTQNEEKFKETYKDIETLIDLDCEILENVDVFISETIKALYDSSKDNINVKYLNDIINILIKNEQYDIFKQKLQEKEQYKTLFIIENIKNEILQSQDIQQKNKITSQEQEIKILKEKEKELNEIRQKYNELQLIITTLQKEKEQIQKEKEQIEKEKNQLEKIKKTNEKIAFFKRENKLQKELIE